MNRSWLLRSVVVLALVLAACGGDSKDKASSTKDTKASTTSTTKGGGGALGGTTPSGDGSSTTSTTKGGGGSSGAFVDHRTDAQAKADEKLAEGAVLVLADLPSGWTVDTSSDDDDSSDDSDDTITDQELEKCLGVDLPDSEEDRAVADSDSFAKDDATIDSDATVYPDETYAKGVFKPLAGDKAAPCIEQITKSESQAETSGEDADPELSFTDISVKKLDVGKFGDEVVAFRLSLSAEYSGAKITSTSDFIIIRGGRTIATLTIGDINKAPDSALVTKLNSTIAGRVARIH